MFESKSRNNRKLQPIVVRERTRRKCTNLFEGRKWEYGERREYRNCSESQQRYYIGIDRHHTVLLSGCVNRPIVGHPLIHVDEFGHEARYFAFHDRAVSPDHVLVLGFGDVELRNDCRRGQRVLILWDTVKNEPFFFNFLINRVDS